MYNMGSRTFFFFFFLSTMHSTCLPCPGYLSNSVIVVQWLRSRLHTNHRWLILVSCQIATATAWTINKTEKTLFLFNRVAKMLLVNFPIEQIKQSEQTEKSLLWSFRSYSCGIRGPHDAESCFVSKLLSTLGHASLTVANHHHSLLHCCICMSHSFTEFISGTKTPPKNPYRLYIWTKNFKNC